MTKHAGVPNLGRANKTLKARLRSIVQRARGGEPDSPLSVGDFHVHFIKHKTLEYLLREVWDREEYFFTARHPAPFILDCGANIGIALLYFKHLYPNARIVAFEPYDPAYQALSANVASNALRDVTIHQLALSSEPGEAELFFDPTHPGSLSMSTRQDRIKGASQKTPAAPLSMFIDGPVDLLKLDIEGAELAVLREVAASGKLQSIDQMIIEYHHHIVPAEDCFSELLQLLEKNGFGYRIQGHYSPRQDHARFQDLLIHAYSKRGNSSPAMSR